MFKSVLNYYNALSIAKKLKFMGTSTAAIAGVISILFIFTYQYSNEKREIEKGMETLSMIVADNIAPALLFYDTEFIDQALSSLTHKEKIKQAYAFDSTWDVLGNYRSHISSLEDKESIERLKSVDRYLWEGRTFYIVVDIISEGKQIGHLAVVASLDEFFGRIFKETSIIALIVALSILITYRFRAVLRDSLLMPIARLNESTNEIIETKSMTNKVEVFNDDEIGELAKNFNIMLDNQNSIQQELQDSHEMLEQQVQERTAQLQAKTNELEALNHELDDKIKEAVAKNSEQEQMLIQQSRSAAMGEMIGNIAHQWRQPLNALGLLMQNLYYSFESDELDLEQMERSMEKGQKLMQNMSKTIDDFRDFFKPNKEIEHFSVSSAINSAVELVSASYKNHNIELKQLLDESLMLDGYPNEFAQVLLNILSNAKDALDVNSIEDAYVHIKCHSTDDAVIVEITDNAGGIDEKIVEKIFDPYFTTKHQDVGTGIGLYMSKMIIENNMHGKITVINMEKGAKFTISMPLAKDKMC